MRRVGRRSAFAVLCSLCTGHSKAAPVPKALKSQLLSAVPPPAAQPWQLTGRVGQTPFFALKTVYTAYGLSLQACRQPPGYMDCDMIHQDLIHRRMNVSYNPSYRLRSRLAPTRPGLAASHTRTWLRFHHTRGAGCGSSRGRGAEAAAAAAAGPRGSRGCTPGV